MKKVIKELIPPFLLKLIKKASGHEYGFFGDFKTWKEAQKLSTGYDAEIILDKVRNSLLEVKAGRAIYERDSVLFDRIEYSWPLLAGLMLAASQNNNKLNVIDFGGSLGSTYFQNRKFLAGLSGLKWNIVEQNKIVEYGRRYFENESLKFFFNIDECFESNPDISVIILSSVIHYVEKPYEVLQRLIESGVRYFIVDRTPLIREKNERIVIQKINPDIVVGCYPVWLLNKDKFVGAFLKHYELIEEFDSFETINIDCEFKGFIFKLR